jgi:hypothetical protein
VSLYFKSKGQQAALQKLGLLQTYAPATGESGRLRLRTNEDPKTQTNTAFNEFERAFDRDTQIDSSQFSVGSGQSTTNKEARATTNEPLYRSIFKEVQQHKKTLDVVNMPAPGFVKNWAHRPPGVITPKSKAILVTNTQAPNPFAMAHELGHHRWGQTGIGKILQNKHTNRISNFYPPVLPWVAGNIIGARAGEGKSGYEKTKAVDDARLKATAIASIPFAPRLISETAANVLGTQTFAKHYINLKPQQRTVGALGKGLGTLLLSQGGYSLAYGGPTALAARIRHKHQKEHKK